ncbi:hypothetical protein MLD38_021605 [Melastoma candidum]|uniref:Uncharacterized protein n=1 Tax=Melastoma candidum TaxID=119954 RepID=A0ACB9QGG7_9MYRT|nr:hypothetical protein MLD38_021605 [Melastoma candidum]
MDEGNVGGEIGVPWIPVTPAKKLASPRAGAEPPEIKLDDGSESKSEPEVSPSGSPERVQFDESEVEEEVEDFPPGFEPKVRSTEPAVLVDVNVEALESRRENGGFEGGCFSGGGGHDVSPLPSVVSVARFEMGPFSRLLALANANRLVERHGSACGSYEGPISCSCLICCQEYPGDSSLINNQNGCFPGVRSADSICRGFGGLSESQSPSQFCEIMLPWKAADAVIQETSSPFAPVTPNKAKGLQRKNSETESSSACDRMNSEQYPHIENDVSARGSSEESLKDSQSSTVTKASTESQITDKGDTLGTELKTPQKKERRRKHRPKVVKEGKKQGRPPGSKRTADKAGVSSDIPKPKRKYVRRKGIENAQTAPLEGQGDSANQETVKCEPVKKRRGRKPKAYVEGKTNLNPYVENHVRKRKYVRRKKGVDDTKATPAEVPKNLTDPRILEYTMRNKSCRRVLDFGSDVLPGQGNDDPSTPVPTEGNDDCRNNEAGCYAFPPNKKTRTQLFSPTVEVRCENFQNAVLTGKEAATGPSGEYSNPVEEGGNGSSYLDGSQNSSFQAQRYWALSLSNLQERITVNDGTYSILESDVSAANLGVSSAPPRFISFQRGSAVQFPMIWGPTEVEHSCTVTAGAMTLSERIYQFPAKYMYPQIGTASEAQTKGSYSELLWNFPSCVNDLVKQLKKLNINKKVRGKRNQKQCAISSYDITYRQDNALVLYRPAGSIVPFESAHNETKRRRQRAKVELDEETTKVWQLLLENIDNKGIDGTDEEKAKWWEEERAIFQGRADSFIARMRLVQGDRRFSPWKGSVLDSVVGVFLTQNVSDHLSSSAFMSLAARYPLKASQNSCSDEETNSAVSDFEASVKEQSDRSIPLQDIKEESCENYGEIQNRIVCRNLNGISLEVNITPSFTQLLNLANRSVDPSTYLKEELKHDFAGFQHSCVETSESCTPSSQSSTLIDQKPPIRKSKSFGKEKLQEFDWDSLREKVEACGRKTQRTPDTMDSLDWEALRRAPVSEVADTIKERGMNNRLAERIQDFLNRVLRDHKKLDLEWLRDIPPDKAKEYLLSFRGLGLKSVECVRLLTLHHLAFPVDTNVGRIAVRLGWVPLQPLPESLQLHLLEMYPILESIQQYLWPRLCKLDQGTLYELHYQMITFGKVFCTKSKPNCNACPMRGECRHFASAFASARLALPAPEQSSQDGLTEENPHALNPQDPLPLPSPTEKLAVIDIEDVAVRCRQTTCQPFIEEPASPEPERTTSLENDLEESIAKIEDDNDEIPTIRLNMAEFSRNLQMYLQENMACQEDALSKALVALTPEAASVPAPPLKGYSRLRTEHLVYEIPEGHALLSGLDKLEPDDPCRYLLAIWTPGERADSIRPPERGCTSEDGQLCMEPSCSTCNAVREADSQIVRGTILIPCRTAMQGSFPLNGTYFQVNEVFADHESSVNPLNVPRSLIWNLHRRTVYFGTSVSAIFKGLSTEAIQHCFWRGYVCVRGFDRKTRAPRPLMARLHFPASKMAKSKGKTNNE